MENSPSLPAVSSHETSDFYSGHQIKSLTGLRGVGALLVVFYHYHNHQLIEPFQSIIDFGGTAGVMIFFSLSGYILSYIYQTHFQSSKFFGDYADFIGKRIARIYPLHVFMLFLALFFYPVLNTAGESGPRQLFTNLTLTQGWTFDDFSYIGTSWSISIEFLFYLLFPFMIFFINRKSAVFVFFALGIFYAFISIYIASFPPELMRYMSHRIFFYGTFFVLGVCMFFMTQFSIVRQLLDNNFAFITLVVALIFLSFTTEAKIAASAFIIPFLVRSVHTSRIGKYLLSSAVMLWLGELSYSIYLSHQPIFYLMMRTGHGNPVDYFYGYSSTYILLFIWCIFTYNVIEVPMRSKLRDMFSRRMPG